jgi:RimJ/RimL family protein N-acetyltransferase
VAQKIGFTREGTLRAATPFRGVRQDAWIGAILSTEWRFA